MGAWWVEVDGFVLPKPVSGHPVLELCNTRSGWGEPQHPRQEYLRSYGHLVAAARQADVLDPARADGLARHVQRGTAAMDRELARAWALRKDAYTVLTGSASAAALQRLGRAAARARSAQVLVGQEGRVTWGWTGEPRLTEPLDAFVVKAVDLAVSADASRIGRCPGDGCGWLFLDTSGRRRWCQMSVCGNRAKQARLREEGRGGGGPG